MKSSKVLGLLSNEVMELETELVRGHSRY